MPPPRLSSATSMNTGGMLVRFFFPSASIAGISFSRAMVFFMRSGSGAKSRSISWKAA